MFLGFPARKRLLASVLATALAALSLLPAATALASPDRHNPLKLLGKGGQVSSGKILSFKKQIRDQQEARRESSAKTEQSGQGSTNPGKGAGLFFDLQREVEVESDTWHGSTGLQINW